MNHGLTSRSKRKLIFKKTVAEVAVFLFFVKKERNLENKRQVERRNKK